MQAAPSAWPILRNEEQRSGSSSSTAC